LEVGPQGGGGAGGMGGGLVRHYNFELASGKPAVGMTRNNLVLVCRKLGPRG
jgi:glycerate kinase